MSSKTRPPLRFRKLRLFLLPLCLLAGASRLDAQICGVTSLPPDSGTEAGRPGPNAYCGNTSAIFQSYFKENVNYRPFPGQNTTTTTPKDIKVRAVVITHTDSPYPNYSNDAAGNNTIWSLTQDWPNTMADRSLSDLAVPVKPQPAGCNTCYIQDSRFRIKLVDTDFISTNDASLLGSNRQDISYYVEHYGKSEDSVLNIFFVNYPYAPGSGVSGLAFVPGAYSFLGHNLGVIMYNQYHSHMQSIAKDPPEWWHWTTYVTIIHEIGHLFGLWHMYDNECNPTPSSDFLSDIFPPGVCPIGGSYCDHTNTSTTCTNNYMDGKSEGYFSPMQLGRMHRSAYLSNIARYIYPTEAPSVHPWNITADQTWDFGIRMYQDIIVKAGKTLTIQCEVQMPPNGKIVVEKGAKLILDGGNITSYHPRTSWKGIELYGDKTLAPYDYNQGSLEMINNATIEYAQLGVQDFITGVWSGGGIIMAANSTFKDCRKAVGLNDYPNYPRGTSCSFYRVRFISENEAAATNSSLTGLGVFTAYNETAIPINECTFENRLTTSYLAMSHRNMGIYSQDAGFRIENSTFKGFQTAVYPSTHSNTPARTVKVINNVFQDNGTAIRFADNFSFAQDNHISHMMGYFSPQTSTTNYRMGSGIEAENAGGLIITRNTISQTGENAIGITVTNSKAYGGRVIDNIISQNYIGIQTQKNNQSLDLLCNTLQQSYFAAFSINPQSPGNYILKNQGNGCGSSQYRAGNRFSGNYKDIRSYVTNNWTYHYWAADAPQIPQTTIGSVVLNPCTSANTQDPNSQCNLAGNVESWVESNFDEAHTMWNIEPEGPIRLMKLSHIVSGFNERNDPAGLIAFLEGIGTDDARKLLIPLYIEQGNQTGLDNAINTLTLDEDKRSVYVSYYDVLMRMHANALQPWELNSIDEATVRSVATSGLEGISDDARSFLEFAYNEPWYHLQEQAPEDLGRHAAPATATMFFASQLFDAVPNPAQNKTSIRVWLTAKDAGQSSLQVRNLMGKVVREYALAAGENTVEIAAQDLPAGLYVYSLVTDKRIAASKKLIIVK